MLDNYKGYQVNAVNALLGTLLTLLLAAGFGVLGTITDFATAEAFSLGVLGTVTNGLVALWIAIGGAALRNEFGTNSGKRGQKLQTYQRVGSGGLFVLVSAMVMNGTVNSWVTSSSEASVVAIIVTLGLFLVISVADVLARVTPN
jgi:hypothetical protein